MSVVTIKRALISVSDKSGLDQLAECLSKFNIEIISSGGTRAFLEKLGHSVTPIEDITNNPECFGGRMKTLSFQVASALLFRRGNTSDLKEAEDLGIEPIDLVVCNLYPFKETLSAGADLEELVENIDIGGPTMIRAAAKNFTHVTSCSSPKLYSELIKELNQNEGATTLKLRKELSLDCFTLMGQYDSLIAQTLRNEFNIENNKLRYGENPHQEAWVIPSKEESLASVIPLQGKKLSYNNFLDCDAAWRSLLELHTIAVNKKCCVIVKHLNPCGQAISTTTLGAMKLAWDSDPVSSFGSIIALNSEVDLNTANFLDDKFIEIVIAPTFSKDALDIFSKKKNLRLVKLSTDLTIEKFTSKSILGGELIQESDQYLESEYKIATKEKIPLELESLIPFGILTAKNLKSNAISLVWRSGDDFQLIGAGMGNPNRFVSIEQAIAKAKDNGVTDFSNVILVSDAFFPFADSIELSHSHGIKNIIQPGGSIKDKDVIAKCDELGIAMILTSTRHFLH